jgi:hypothetical protein
MMGLTDRLEPWVRRFQRTATARRPGTDSELDPLAGLERASRRAVGVGDDAPPARRTGRFARKRVLQEQES